MDYFAAVRAFVCAAELQSFSKTAGSSLCPSTASFTSAFGPVTDSSVKGNPKVFLN